MQNLFFNKLSGWSVSFAFDKHGFNSLVVSHKTLIVLFSDSLLGAQSNAENKIQKRVYSVGAQHKKG